MSDGWVQYLTCPACNEACTTIPSCRVAHLACVAEAPDIDDTWCEDRSGVCSCGANLYVRVDDDRAYLEEVEE